MPVRVILDSTFTTTIKYYALFPAEPTEDPAKPLEVKLPLEKEDQLVGMTLLSFLKRLEKVPEAEKQLIVGCHGTPVGLAMKLVTGTEFQPTADILDLLTDLGKAQKEVDAVKQLPKGETKKKKWQQILTSVSYQGKKLIKRVGDEEDETYEKLWEYMLSMIVAANPKAVTTSNEVEFGNFPALVGVSRQQLIDLYTLGNKLRSRFNRFDFRCCNTGRNRPALVAIRTFFGLQQVCIPDVFVLNAEMTTNVDPNFDKSLDNNIDKVTQSVTGKKNGPVWLNPGNNDAQETLPLAQVPKSRGFDVVQNHPSDDVWMRLWITSIHPHALNGWMVGVDRTAIREFIAKKIHANTTKYKDGDILPLQGLWMRDDHNAALHTVPSGSQGLLDGDPLAPPPPPPIAFTLPLEPEYNSHLVLDPKPAPPTPAKP